MKYLVALGFLGMASADCSGDYNFDGLTWAQYSGGSYVAPLPLGTGITYNYEGTDYTVDCTTAYGGDSCKFQKSEVDPNTASNDITTALQGNADRQTFIDMCATLCSDAKTGNSDIRDEIKVAFYMQQNQYWCFCATSEPNIQARTSNAGWIAAKIGTCATGGAGGCPSPAPANPIDYINDQCCDCA